MMNALFGQFQGHGEVLFYKKDGDALPVDVPDDLPCLGDRDGL